VVVAVSVFGLADHRGHGVEVHDGGEVEIVRWTEVTGTPSFITRSSSGTLETCRQIRSEERLRCGTVTSIRVLPFGLVPQSAAADQWLSSARGPEASTAAIQRPWRVSDRWPTA
jgi:hypothetical protein